MGLIKSKSERNKKPSCPFKKHCFTDSSVCGRMGEYAECPQTVSAVSAVKGVGGRG